MGGDMGPDPGMPGEFAGFFVLAVIVAIVSTVWKVSTARRVARNSGMDEDDATQMALFTDYGLEATYLAANLRPSQESPPGPAAAEPRPAELRLRELESLRAQGLITEEEYAARRRDILDAL